MEESRGECRSSKGCRPGGVPMTNELLASLGLSTHILEEGETSKHIVLYFGASWCGDCVSYLPTLKRAYEDAGNDRNWEVVYVSSDVTIEEYQTCMKEKHGEWLAIPFEDRGTRTELKKKYKICARKEADELGITDRVDGLPCLLWIGGGDVVCDEISLPCIITRDIQQHGAKWLSVKQQQKVLK